MLINQLITVSGLPHACDQRFFFFPVSPYFLSHLHFCLCWYLPPVVTSGTSSGATEGKVCVHVCLLMCVCVCFVLFHELPLFCFLVSLCRRQLLCRSVSRRSVRCDTHWCPLGFCNLLFFSSSFWASCKHRCISRKWDQNRCRWKNHY